MELALKPAMLSVLKLKLDEALAQVRTEDVGRGAIDKLQLLNLLSALPDDGEGLETGDHFTLIAVCRLLQMTILLLRLLLCRVQRSGESA